MTEDQWASIPDVGDMSLRYKQNRKQDEFTPLSDSLLEQLTLQNRAIAPSTITSQAAADVDGGGYKSVVTNMTGLSAARGAVLGMTLDKTAGAASTMITNNNNTAAPPVLDKSGYLTSLFTCAPAIAATSRATMAYVDG